MAVGNAGFANESNCVSTLDVAIYTLGKAPDFIGRGDGQLFLIDRVLQQLSIVEEFTHGFVEHREHFVNLVFES